MILRDAQRDKIISRQEYKTIKGQWKSGDEEGAVKGYKKLWRRHQKRTTVASH